jgi:AcrR family transcriptional regulator
MSYDIAVAQKGDDCKMPFQTFFNLSDDKREQIVDAIIDELYENGYEKTSIAKIIEKAKIPRGSFYQYFHDKKDLYKYIIIEVIGKKKQSYSGKALLNIDTMKFIDIIRELYTNGIRFYRDYPKLASIATAFITSRDAELKKEILSDSDKISNEFFKSIIDKKKLNGEIDEKIDTDMLNYFINSLNMSFADYFIEKCAGIYDNDDLFLTIDKLVYILSNGISKI